MKFLREMCRVTARIVFWLPIQVVRLCGAWIVVGAAFSLIANCHGLSDVAILTGLTAFGAFLVAGGGRLDRLLRPSR
jgi:ABC-type uncharacterized transport system YnjBCD permease subunit